MEDLAATGTVSTTLLLVHLLELLQNYFLLARGCFKCGGPHLARDCTEASNEGVGYSNENRDSEYDIIIIIIVVVVVVVIITIIPHYRNILGFVEITFY